MLTAFAAEADGFDDLLAAFRRGEVEADQVRSALKDCGADARAQDLARSLVDEALRESRQAAAALRRPGRTRTASADTC